MPAFRTAAAVLIVACGSLSSCGPTPQEEAEQEPPNALRNVLMVVVDTLRTDSLGCYGSEGNATPNIDAFAQISTRFENAYSQATRTHPAISSMLTGLYPPSNGVATQAGTLRGGVLPLQLIAQANGIATGLFSANLCELHSVRANVFSEGWDEQFCGINYSIDQWRWDRAVVTNAQKWIEAQGSSWFAMVHLMDPHSEHRPPPQHWDRDKRPLAEKNQELAQFQQLENAFEFPKKPYFKDLHRRYAAEVRGIDELVGQLLWWMSTREDADNTIVVLVSDHGEELFSSWPKAGHALSLTDWVLSVPMILHVPGRPAAVVEETVETMQLTPTLLDLLELPAPYAFECNSLLSEEPRGDYAVSFSGNVSTVTSGGKRLWQHVPELDSYKDMEVVFEYMPGARRAPWFLHPRIYAEQAAFREDIGEFVPVEGEDWPAEVRFLNDAFSTALPVVMKRAAGRREVSAEFVEQLKALGYTEGDL